MGHSASKEILPCPGTEAEKEDDDPGPQPWQIHIQSNEERAADAESESAYETPLNQCHTPQKPP